MIYSKVLLSNHRKWNKCDFQQMSTLIRQVRLLSRLVLCLLTIRRLHAPVGMSPGLIPAMHLCLCLALSAHDRARSPALSVPYLLLQYKSGCGISMLTKKMSPPWYLVWKLWPVLILDSYVNKTIEHTKTKGILIHFTLLSDLWFKPNCSHWRHKSVMCFFNSFWVSMAQSISGFSYSGSASSSL